MQECCCHLLLYQDATPLEISGTLWAPCRRRGQGGWRCGRGDPGDRVNLEGSLEPADSGSIILRGMQFPQQQWVRGQRGEPAAPLGIAVLPPLPNAAGRGVGARCRGAGPAGPRGHGGEGRRRSGGRVGRGGGRAGAAGEAAEAQCGVVSKDVTNCLQEQQTLVNPWAAGGGSAAGSEAPEDPRPSARGPSHLRQRPACTALGESLQPPPPSEATGTPVCPSW